MSLAVTVLVSLCGASVLLILSVAVGGLKLCLEGVHCVSLKFCVIKVLDLEFGLWLLNLLKWDF